MARRDKSIAYARTSIITLILCILISLNSFDYNFKEKNVGLFHGSFQTSMTTHIFQTFIFIISALILQLNAFLPRKVWTDEFSSLLELIFNNVNYYSNLILNKMSGQYRILEYPLIILFIIVGGTFLMSSCDLISVFLAIELQSYGLYILCTVHRDSEKATSAGLTYFLLGGLSSCFILLASSLIYSNSGNTSFDNIYIIYNISSVNDFINSINLFLHKSYFINFSLTIMSIGFLFKIAAAPFHFWSPDVYDAIPTVVTTFVAIFAKISILVLILQLIYYTNGNNIPNLTKTSSLSGFSWTFSLLTSSLLSLVIGSILGLTQLKIKKLYAYSTISHIGFMLLALSVNSIESIQSFVFYLIQYSVSNLNAFLLLITIGFSLYMHTEKKKHVSLSANLTDRSNSPLQLVSQLKGYFYINPMLAVSFIITIFSFVGIPPLMGFFAKQMVLSSALDNGYVFMTLVGILTSVISAYYYLVLVKRMFFQKSDYIKSSLMRNVIARLGRINNINIKWLNNLTIGDRDIVLSGSFTGVISSLSLIILLFILNPQQLLGLTNVLALNVFNK